MGKGCAPRGPKAGTRAGVPGSQKETHEENAPQEKMEGKLEEDSPLSEYRAQNEALSLPDPEGQRQMRGFMDYIDLQTESEAVGLNEVNKWRLNAAKCSLPPPNLGEFPLLSNEVNRSVCVSFSNKVRGWNFPFFCAGSAAGRHIAFLLVNTQYPSLSPDPTSPSPDFLQKKLLIFPIFLLIPTPNYVS